MDRRDLWPDWRAEWILYEDADLIAVNKPVGISSQAADPERADDVVTRLKRFLSDRDGCGSGGPYLGVHQRLDRDTSGVLLYARTRAANPGLARQFEGRTARKRYVAAVEGWKGGERVLRDRIAPGRGGTMRVVAPGDRRGRSSVTRARPVARRGSRAVLDVDIETGRTHQVRVQLAHAGVPVAGDRLYGGPPAARLMLHASSLELEHPLAGRPLRLAAPEPPELAGWLRGEEAVRLDDPAALEIAVRRAAEARWGLARSVDSRGPTTAFRLLHGPGDGVPGLAVDVYGDHLVAHLYEELAPAVREAVLDVIHGLGFAGVYLKQHPRQAHRLDPRSTEELAPSRPVRGEPAPEELVIEEHGVPHLVRLGDGLSTGIFLDQRENRRRVRQVARGARVLNLFSYTGAFTLAAATGGADSSVSVDASARALERARRGLAHLAERMDGAVSAGAHRFVRADAFEALHGLARAHERFDLVIVDPPTYSTTRRTRWRSGRGWVALAAAALGVVAPGGRLLACSNDQRLRQGALRRSLHEAARRAGRGVASLRDLPPPVDFPPGIASEPHLKSLFLTVDD